MELLPSHSYDLSRRNRQLQTRVGLPGSVAIVVVAIVLALVTAGLGSLRDSHNSAAIHHMQDVATYARAHEEVTAKKGQPAVLPR